MFFTNGHWSFSLDGRKLNCKDWCEDQAETAEVQTNRGLWQPIAEAEEEEVHEEERGKRGTHQCPPKENDATYDALSDGAMHHKSWVVEKGITGPN